MFVITDSYLAGRCTGPNCMVNMYQTDRIRRRSWVNIVYYYTTPTLNSSKVARAEQTRVRLTSHRIPCAIVQDINCVPARRRSGVHERKLIESLPPFLISFRPSVPPLPKEATMHVTEVIYILISPSRPRPCKKTSFRPLNSNPLLVSLGHTCAGYRFQHSTASGTYLELPSSAVIQPCCIRIHIQPAKSGQPLHHTTTHLWPLSYSATAGYKPRERRGKKKAEEKCFRQLTWSHNCCCIKKTFFFLSCALELDTWYYS